jgi:hypothetical protein
VRGGEEERRRGGEEEERRNRDRKTRALTISLRHKEGCEEV